MTSFCPAGQGVVGMQRSCEGGGTHEVLTFKYVVIALEVILDEDRYAALPIVGYICRQQRLYLLALTGESEHDLLRSGLSAQSLRVSGKYLVGGLHLFARRYTIFLLADEPQHLGPAFLFPLTAGGDHCAVLAGEYFGQGETRHLGLVIVCGILALHTDGSECQEGQEKGWKDSASCHGLVVIGVMNFIPELVLQQHGSSRGPQP